MSNLLSSCLLLCSRWVLRPAATVLRGFRPAKSHRLSLVDSANLFILNRSCSPSAGPEVVVEVGWAPWHFCPILLPALSAASLAYLCHRPKGLLPDHVSPRWIFQGLPGCAMYLFIGSSGSSA